MDYFINWVRRNCNKMRQKTITYSDILRDRLKEVMIFMGNSNCLNIKIIIPKRKPDRIISDSNIVINTVVAATKGQTSPTK